MGANAFFVGAEFSLISARRDRLETLAEQGRSSAVTVIRAGEQLPLMFAGAQLGITVSSMLLGRLGEPAVADLLRRPFAASASPPRCCTPCRCVVALAIVVTLHVLLGEMVPKNIAIAGPEKAAMLLIPTYLVYVRTVRPIIALYNRCTHATLRALRVQPRDELDVTVSTVELSEMIAESVSEGLLDPEEHTRLTRALQIRNRLVADVAVPVTEIRAVPVAAPGLRADGRGDGKGAGRNRLLPLSGRRRRRQIHRIPAHQGCAATRVTTRRPWSTWRRVRPLPQIPQSLSVPEALSRMRRSKSHLALVTGQDGAGGRDGGAGGSGPGPGRRGARRDASVSDGLVSSGA